MTLFARHLALGLTLSLLASPAFAQTLPPILPQPQKMVLAKGSMTIADGAAIAVPTGDKAAANAARLLINRAKIERGLTLVQATGTAQITLSRDPAIQGDETYRLVVDATGIRVTASGDRGLIHGVMSVAQLLSPDRAIGKPVSIPALTIEDAPRFAWRGLMIDPVRHFHPLDGLRAIIDQMASVKLNTLHLHLTDDQGWRFEVKKYPKLTEIGAWRTPPSAGEAPRDKVGGFYTQEELKALVAYAAERGITIVPEIDLPGHAQALVAAYPEFGVFGDRPEVSHDWGINPYLFNPGPKGVQFVKDVLDELMDVFPGTYIHLGGDEAIKDQWQRSPEVQAQIKALGLRDENHLQTWLIDQFGAYLTTKGRRLIGWDEILDGGIPPSASIMSWRGEKGAVAAANSGHDVVLSPAPTLYLDSLQSNRADEPPGRLSIQTLADVYRYDPMPAGIDAERAKHVLGAQANAWSEYLATPYQVQHVVFPRAAAVAEITWSAKEQRDFKGFLTRLDPQIERWRRSGIHVADSAFAVDFTLKDGPGAALKADKVTLTLSNQSGYGSIRYTLDGKEPTAKSSLYKAPLSVKHGVVVKAAAFAPDGAVIAAARSFDTSRQALLTRSSSQMAACPNGALGLRVPLVAGDTANAPAFNINLFDTCTRYAAAPLDGVKSMVIDVARLPRHYGLAHEARMLREHYAVTTHGELVVTAGCPVPVKKGEQATGDKPIVLATFPLPDPATSPNRFTFKASLPAMSGEKDICLQFTSALSDPFYTVETLSLKEKAE